nr:hypothetical protein [Tanacetum cinerariifolium]
MYVQGVADSDVSKPARGNEGKLIQKLLLNQKCMGYLVRAYYSISSTKYYKDESCWNADVKSKTTEDIIINRSFMEVFVLNHYVLVKNVLKFENLVIDGQAILLDEAGNPLKKVEYPGDHDSEDEVTSVDNDMVRDLASERTEFGTQSLLEQ